MSISQDDVIRSIPSYLRQFVVRQHYDRYTPQDHAVWRYVMRRNVNFLGQHAHPAYLEGLRKTGIGLDRIPDIDDMNAALSKIGWRAVVVDGFVPPAAFMEFQAHRILVISADIRTIDHILYTPAPDIIHEAAGHAPIIADETYSTFLRKFGEYGSKAVFSQADYELYEAIRHLSILKEFPGTPEADLKAAEEDLAAKAAANTDPSESALLARMHWWTVEYGLVGTVRDFKIFGAGILSSVGESKACLDPAVVKLPLDADCVRYDYDITRMQPQLFVARDFDHLIDVLETYADGMAFRRGGVPAAREVIKSGQVGTWVFDSGLQVSGRFTDIRTDAQGNPAFIRTSGPTQLAHGDRELTGHGIGHHADGFSSPVGSVEGLDMPLAAADEGDLLRIGLDTGREATLRFRSGYVISGHLSHILRKDGRNLVFTWRNCTVRDPQGEVVYHPDWGVFDQAVGAGITSAYSGTADKEQYNVYPPKSDKTAIPIHHTDNDRHLFQLHTRLRDLRAAGTPDAAAAADISRLLDLHHPTDWLSRLELVEYLKHDAGADGLRSRLESQLQAFRKTSEELDDLIGAGFAVLSGT